MKSLCNFDCTGFFYFGVLVWEIAVIRFSQAFMLPWPA